MEHESMDLQQLASYLNRDVREVDKMANRGHLPGRKVSGQWRFASAEINYWLETQMHTCTEKELSVLEQGPGKSADGQLSIADLLTESTMAVPMQARTKKAVLKELVALPGPWQVYDPDALLNAIKQREEMNTTATGTGVAFPHPHRPLPLVVGESVVAFGRSTSGIPFGSPHGSLTDLFFLVACTDQATHLRVLARLSRLVLRDGVLEQLRQADTAADAYDVIIAAERELVG